MDSPKEEPLLSETMTLDDDGSIEIESGAYRLKFKSPEALLAFSRSIQRAVDLYRFKDKKGKNNAR